jgi:hydrogenase maturation protease
MGRSIDLLVLGLGNVLCGDDGVGVLAAQAIARRFQLPDGVRVLDGGTLGLSLLPYFEEAREAILIDAVATGEAPGTPVRLEGDDVLSIARQRLSVHQIGVADLLDAARLRGVYPERVVLFGVVPESIELGVSLTPAVEAELPRLVERVTREARARGFDVSEARP